MNRRIEFSRTTGRQIVADHGLRGLHAPAAEVDPRLWKGRWHPRGGESTRAAAVFAPPVFFPYHSPSRYAKIGNRRR
jgi:hypothetical protein